MDKNKDGIVTLDEFLESCQEVSKERPQNIKSLDLGKEIWGLRACRREGMRNLWPQVRATTTTPTNSKLRIPAPSPPATGLWLVLAKHSLSQTAWAGYGLGWMWKPKGSLWENKDFPSGQHSFFNLLLAQWPTPQTTREYMEEKP